MYSSRSARPDRHARLYVLRELTTASPRKIRCSGAVMLGTRQSGMPGFHIAWGIESGAAWSRATMPR